MERINLICLPFAGGNRYSYRSYEGHTPDWLHLVPLEYPGRGLRLDKPLLRDSPSIVEDICQQLTGNLALQGRYALYGHSLGGLIAFLLTKELLRRRQHPPEALFISGAAGPAAHSRTKKIRHCLAKPEFIQELVELNGGPALIYRHSELFDFIEPILRADFQVSETYAYRPDCPIDIPITVFRGTDNDISEEDALLWQRETVASFDCQTLTGNHFFIFDHPRTIIDTVASGLSTH